MTELSLPPALAKAEPFALGVTMANLNADAAAGTITIYRATARCWISAPVTIAPGESRLDFPVHPNAPGLVDYRAVFKPAEPGARHLSGGRRAAGLGGIGAQRKVLILTDTERDAQLSRRRSCGASGSTRPPWWSGNGGWNGNPKGYDAGHSQ